MVRRILRRLGIFLVLVVLIGFAASWIVAGSLVAPAPYAVGDPPATLAAAETISLDGGIAGWHVRGEKGKGVVVLLHPIQGSRLSMVGRAEFLHAAGYSVVLIDFRAHGTSAGESITMGHLEAENARAAVAFAKKAHPGERVAVDGASLGGVAAILASPLEVDALVLEAPYPDLESAVRNRVTASLGPLAGIPTKLLLLQLRLRLDVPPDQLRPIDRMADLGCPVLLISGMKDNRTTVDDMKALYAAAKEPKQLRMIGDAGHVDLHRFAQPVYEKLVLTFLATHLR